MTFTDSEGRDAGTGVRQPDLFAANCRPPTIKEPIVALDTDTHEQTDCQNEVLDWRDEEPLVFRRQLSVAVYRTPDGGLVIRQERDWNEEDDTYIVTPPQNVGAFVDRLVHVAGIPSEVSRAYQAGHDLELPLGDDRMLRIECKARGDGFRELYSWLQKRDLLVLKADRREPLVVAGLSLAAEIAKGAG
jgi:hypothetical protein